MSALPRNPDVIVIGAGTAGLAAAQALRQGGLETLVLEAAGHVGGRCVTDTETFPVPFDRGGSWLHAASLNPLARIAETQGVPLHKTDWTRRRMHSAGYDLTPAEVAEFDAYYEDMWPVIDARGEAGPDAAILDCLPPTPWLKEAAHTIAHMQGGDAEVASATDNFRYADGEGDWLPGGGLGAFVARLHADVPVRLGCAVSRIDWSGPGVRVTTPQGEVQARFVVVTVSTGILAAGKIVFVPPLPPRKRDAIALLPNGLLNKIGVLFDPAWKEAAEGDIVDYRSGDDGFCEIFFGFCGSDLAVGFTGGRFGAALEREGTGAATDFCLEALRATFGSDALDSVRRTEETAWRSNQHTLGAYSYAIPGGSDARPVLAETLADRVFFAGEATSVDAFSTVHGAYQSGQRAAADILSGLAE